MRLARSILGPLESAAVTRVLLEDGYLGMGAEVQSFECEIGEFLGVETTHVICVNSGTAALHLALEAVLAPGDEVLVPSLTYVATFQAISAAGAVPVACDVHLNNASLDLSDAESRLSERTRAIMPVHYASFPAGLDAIYDFARARGLRVIEDAAHAFGGTTGGRMIGSFGDVACFSFDGIKNITSGEGGAVVTRDGDVAGRVRDARLLGVEKDTEQRYGGSRSWEFEVTRKGYRYHMSNLFAAIGRVQLKRLPTEFGPARVRLAQRYRRRLDAVEGIALLDTDLDTVIPHIQPVRVLDGRRDEVAEALEAATIQTGIHYKPNHLLALYGGGCVRLPVAERLYGELLSLPLHPGMIEVDVDRVCDVISGMLASRVDADGDART